MVRLAAVLLFFVSTRAFAVDVCLFDAGEKHKHEIKLTRLFAEQTKGCADCRLKSFPIYDERGNQSPELVLSQLQKSKGQCSLLHFSWNREAMVQWDPVIKELARQIAAGTPVVGAAGAPEGPEVAAQVSRTVLGMVKDIVLIGELDKKGKLIIDSYRGSEILTALAPPPGEKGSSFSSMLFTARWAKVFDGKKPAEWLTQFRANKEASATPWPSMDELFSAKQSPPHKPAPKKRAKGT